jgi:hypothetical protein
VGFLPFRRQFDVPAFEQPHPRFTAHLRPELGEGKRGHAGVLG